MAALFQVDKYILAVCIGGRLMAGMRRSSVSLTQKTVQSIRLFGLLVAQLCTYSMLSALCFAYPLYLFDYKWIVNVIWRRCGDSVHTRRTRSSGWRNLGG